MSRRNRRNNETRRQIAALKQTPLSAAEQLRRSSGRSRDHRLAYPVAPKYTTALGAPDLRQFGLTTPVLQPAPTETAWNDEVWHGSNWCVYRMADGRILALKQPPPWIDRTSSDSLPPGAIEYLGTELRVSRRTAVARHKPRARAAAAA